MATISLSKTMVLLPYYGGNDTINITVDGSTLSSYSLSGTTGLTITQDASSFTIDIRSNPNNNSERFYSPTVTVNAADGTSQTIQLYVFQKAYNITIADSAREKTLGATEVQVYYFLQCPTYGNSYDRGVCTKVFGDVTLTSTDLDNTSNGFPVYLNTANNTTSSMQNAVFAISYSDGGTNSVTAFVLLHKKGVAGSITLSPSQTSVGQSAGTATSTVTTDGIVSALSTSYWGDGNVSTVTSATVSNGTLTVAYGANTTGSTVTNYIRVSGTDSNGDTQGATLTMTQLPQDPYIGVSPVSRNVDATAGSTSFTLSSYEVSNITASSTDSWITNCQISGSTLTVTYAATSSYLPRIGDVTISGTSSLGGTITETAAVSQKALAGTISVSPSSYVSDGAADTATFTVTSNGINNVTSNVYPGGIDFTSVTFVGGTLTASLPANTSGSTLTDTILLRGTDGNGDTIRFYVPFEQRTVPTITFSTASRTLNPTETTAYYPIRVYNVENPTVSFSGTVSIDHYTFTQDQSDPTLYTLYVYTNDNTGSTQQSSTITVSGTSALGTSATGTGTLIKRGTGGSITVSPTSKTVSKAAGTVTFNVTMTDIVSHTESSSGNITFSNISISNGVLSATYPANATGENRSGYLSITGTDSNGDTVYSPTITVVQLGEDPSITINPASKTLQATEANGQYVVTYENMVTPLSVSVSGTVNVTNYSLQAEDFGYYLMVTTGDNTGSSDLTSTFTVTGTDVLGGTQTQTATLIKKAAGGSITISPTSKTVTYEAGSTTFTVTSSAIVGALTLSDSGEMPITSATLDNGTITVVYPAATGYTNKSHYFVVSGTDGNGDRQSFTATLTQQHPPITGTIVLSPATRTVNSPAGTTTFSVTTNDMDTSTLTVSHSGNVSISSCTLSSDKRTVNITYGANTSTTNAKTSTITVSGDDMGGTARTGTATLSQARRTPTTYTFEFNPSSQSAKSISVSPTSVRYTIDSYKSGESSATLGYDVDDISYTGSWPAQINTRYEDGKPYFGVPMNMTGNSRTATIRFIQDESGLTITSVITQAGGGASSDTFLPIWRDDVYTASANDFIEYHITLGGDIIYAAKAYKYPDENDIEWTINDVCENYIGTDLNFTSGIQRIPNYCKTFSVVTNQNVLKNSRFYNSWAYEDTDYWLSDPIDYRVDCRQWLPISFLSSNSRNITVGSTSYTASADDDGWTVMTDLSGLTLQCGSSLTVTPGVGSARQYKIDSGDFALYYANAFGGWDALLVKGTTKKTDNIEHLNYRRKSGSLSDFSKINYQNNITPTWSLNTGITINGKKMYHLLESTKVYLHNLETNEIIPVIITNAQCEYLTYTNNGKKPYYYNITVEESNLKLRK